MATFSVIGTPIGNLEDITLRALRTLSAADVILCEDTRVTRTLLNKHDIIKKDEAGAGPRILSYHAHSALSRTDHIIEALKGGANVALVSDAGTPGISDPGSALVARMRIDLAAEIASGAIKIEAVPGPSALASALSIAGVPCADFTFLGFLPHKKGRETLFKEIAAAERAMIFYESPHRILKALASLVEHLEADLAAAAPKRVTICRELTKIFEEVVQGSPREVLAYFESHPDKVRGEFVVIVG